MSERWYAVRRSGRSSARRPDDLCELGDACVPVCTTTQGGRVGRSRRGRGPLTPTGPHAMMLFEHGMCRTPGAAHTGAQRTTPRALGSTR